MFEEIFRDGLDNKQRLLQEETRNAIQKYEEERRFNPSMREIDFSNPVSTNITLNTFKSPYGFTGNPNRIPNPYRYNPYNNNSYRGWVNNRYFNRKYDPKCMDATEEELDKGIIQDPSRRKNDEVYAVDEELPRESYMDKLLCTNIDEETAFGLFREAFEEQERIAKANKIETDREGNRVYIDDNGIRYIIKDVKIKGINKKNIKFVAESDLNLTLEEEIEINEIISKLEVYDKALCGLFYSIFEETDNITREDYLYMKRYCNEKLEYYKNAEGSQPFNNYRAEYRYRKKPVILEDENGPVVDENNKEYEYGFIINRHPLMYSYDAGKPIYYKDPDFEIFTEAAYINMTRAINKMREEDFNTLNKIRKFVPAVCPGKITKMEDLVLRNPQNPFEVRMYNAKKQEIEYYDNMNIYKWIFRNQMTDDEFNEWWFGKSAANVVNPNQNSQQYYINMQRNGFIAQLNSFVPFEAEKEMLAKEWNDKTLKAYKEYMNGAFDDSHTLGELMDDLNYLEVRNYELEMEAIREELKYKQVGVSPDKFNRKFIPFLSKQITIYDRNNYKTPFGKPDEPDPSGLNPIDVYHKKYKEALDKGIDPITVDEDYGLIPTYKVPDELISKTDTINGIAVKDIMAKRNLKPTIEYVNPYLSDLPPDIPRDQPDPLREARLGAKLFGKQEYQTPAFKDLVDDPEALADYRYSLDVETQKAARERCLAGDFEFLSNEEKFYIAELAKLKSYPMG